MIWKDNKYVTAALVFFSSAQLIFAVVCEYCVVSYAYVEWLKWNWSSIVGAAGVKTQWDAHYNVCIIVSQNPQKGLFSFYMYSMSISLCGFPPAVNYNCFLNSHTLGYVYPHLHGDRLAAKGGGWTISSMDNIVQSGGRICDCHMLHVRSNGGMFHSDFRMIYECL